MIHPLEIRDPLPPADTNEEQIKAPTKHESRDEWDKSILLSRGMPRTGDSPGFRKENEKHLEKDSIVKEMGRTGPCKHFLRT